MSARSMLRPAAFLLTAALTACGESTPPFEPIAALPRLLTADEQEIIAASNDFGLDLFRRVYTGAGPGEPPAEEYEPDTNVFLSPLSASMALGMALNGAVGDTWTGMRAGLAFDDLSQDQVNAAYRSLIDLLVGLDERVDFAIGNSVWTRQDFPVLQSFYDVVQQYFDAEARSLDFDDPTSVDTINAWIRAATNGLIEEGIEQISVYDMVFLINAIYFQGLWTDQFDPEDTRPASFERADGSTVTVDMMSLKAEFRTASTETFRAAELPYGGGAYSMVVVLPHRDVALADVVVGLQEGGWDVLTERLDALEAGSEIPLELPKFTTAYDIYLNDALRAMGMDVAFGVDADFGNLTPVDVCIQYVRQKSFVEVDEAGTKAAAVTVVSIGLTSAPTPFVVDRPFIFALRERFSGTVLFIGAIGDPTLEDAPDVVKPAPGC